MIDQPAPEFIPFDPSEHPPGFYWLRYACAPIPNVGEILIQDARDEQMILRVGNDEEERADLFLIGPRIHQPSKLAELERKAAAYDSLAAMIEHGPIDAAHFRLAGEGQS